MADQPKRPSQEVVDKATAALETVRAEWLRRPGVTAVDVGFKYTDGQMTDTIAIRVHVERKLPVAALEEWEVFNVTEAADSTVGDIPIDVIEGNYGPSTAATATAGRAPVVLEDADFPDADIAAEPVDRRARAATLVGGISVGNPRITAGTLGSIVFDRATCKPMILSNYHVLAGSRTAAIGEDIWQQGRADGGNATSTVANLTRFRLDADMDAAVATLDGSRAHDREVLGLGTITGTTSPALGVQVVKSGRTTGITRGLVDGVNMSVSINYGAATGTQTLHGQFRIVPRPPWPSVDYECSKGGDSGSVWMVESTRRAVGLHFAGETDPAPASENAIANPIEKVATELNFSFSPVLCPIRPVPWLDLCRRYPVLCRFRWPDPIWPLPPVPIPFPGPGPIGARPVGPGPIGGGGITPHAEGGGCGCGGDVVTGPAGDGHGDQLMRELVAFVLDTTGHA